MNEQEAAQAAVQAAEREAAKLLAELEAGDDRIPPSQKYQLRPEHAPGEGPDRDPAASVARPSNAERIDAMFRPVTSDDFRKPTNTSSHTVDFAQKIRDAQKFKGSH